MGAPEPTRRVRGEERAQLARDALRPLGPDERPPALRVAIVVCVVLAIAVVVGAATVHDLSRHGGSLPGAALLAFQIIVTSLALVVASTLLAATVCLVSVGLGGWLFWKLVRVMSRIQAGERERGAPPG